jgi:hypothetical protein
MARAWTTIEAEATAEATAKTNTGVLRFAQNDDVKQTTARTTATATATTTAEADPYGMTNKRARARATATGIAEN